LAIHLLYLESEEAKLKVHRSDTRYGVYHSEDHLVVHRAVVDVILLKARVYRDICVAVRKKRKKACRRIRKDQGVALNLKGGAGGADCARDVSLCA
jgi:hypothetical protein